VHGLADIKLEQNAGTPSAWNSHSGLSDQFSLGAHLCYAHKRTHLWHTCTGETHTQCNDPNVRMGIRNQLWSREDGYTQGGGAARDGVDCRTSEDYANFTYSLVGGSIVTSGKPV
jgi:hypothetical protein